MIKLYKVFIGSYGIFLASWLQLFQQHSESLSPRMLKWVLRESYMPVIMMLFFFFFPWPQTSNNNNAYTLTEYCASEENTDISQELSPENSVVTKSISSNKSAHPSTLLQCSESGHHREKSKTNGKITLWLFFCRTDFPLLNLTKLNLVWLPELDVGAFAVCFVFISTKLRVFSSCFENSLILHLFAAPYELYDKHSVIKPVIFS